MAILLSDVWHSAMIDFEGVSSRIFWVKFKFSRVKVCVVIWYGLNEGNSEERKRFRNGLDGVLDRVAHGYILCVLEILNLWTGDRMRERYN